MPRDLREGNAAVACGVHDAAAVRTEKRDEEINHSHQQAAEYAGADGVGGDSLTLLDPEAADDVDDNNAEGETRQSVHGIVALKETLKEGLVDIVAGRLYLGDGGAGAGKRDNDKNAEKDQKSGVEYLADPGHYPAWVERKQQRRGKKDQREQQQVHRELIRVPGNDLLKTDRKGGCRTAGDREEGSYRKIERAGEKACIRTADPAAQLKEAAAAANT